MTSTLLKTLALLYKMQADDQAALERDLLDRRKAAWRSALREKAREYGCTTAAPRDPSGRDLSELRAMSADDAKSIAATWNRDVERQLQRLFDANPRGNRYYYYSRMEAWAAERATWKNAQIALMTEQSTRFYAQDRFRQENGLRGVRYLFVGPAPVCEICVRHFAAGLVDEAYVRRNPAPVHIGCPHEWKEQAGGIIPCGEMWVG